MGSALRMMLASHIKFNALLADITDHWHRYDDGVYLVDIAPIYIGMISVHAFRMKA